MTEQVSLRDRLCGYVMQIFYVSLLYVRNAAGKANVTQPGGPVVSLTTHGTRCRTVFLAVESIARGTLLPSRLILWIDDIKLFERLPRTIKRLQSRGLEVHFCPNYGPHTKYYPYLETQSSFDRPLVTADDDQLYPQYWLAKLAQAHESYPDCINCHWAVIMDVDDGGIAPYHRWKRCASPEPSYRYFALGVSGVIYPPRFLALLKELGTAFRDCCPRADDIWLHMQALRASYKIRQIATKELQSLKIPRSQHEALSRQNDQGGANDHQVKQTYNPSDVDKLRIACDGGIYTYQSRPNRSADTGRLRAGDHAQGSVLQ
jgi:hypothetical protein